MTALRVLVRPLATSLVLGLAAGAAAAETDDPPFLRTEERAPCADHEPLRRPFFGDLHVHTTFSHDASTQGTRTRPREVYAFARGEPLGIQPFGEDGEPLRTVQLSRPLDFAAVTDHAELLGEVHICETPGLVGHDSIACRLHRWWPRLSFFLMNTHVSRGTGERMGLCGPEGARCREAALTPWREIQDAAEATYDRSPACRFTTFVGYEWTASVVGRNLHRNVIFRNRHAPALPASYYEAPSPSALWEALGDECIEAEEACEALVIPHNANLSAGLMWKLEEGFTAAEARSRSRWEPLVEVMQHKGSSECWWGPGAADEECAFEQLPFDSFRGKFLPLLAHPPRREDTVRWALGRGLEAEAELGANPFRLGQLASTDTHLGAAGLVAEDAHPGHGGAGAPSPDRLPPGLPDDVFFNPGGLAAVWAEENSRDALFAALRRREVYGTSGPRLVVRLFAGWDYPEDLCRGDDFAAAGYAGGVPMGGVLEGAPGAGASPSPAGAAPADAGASAAAGSVDAPSPPAPTLAVWALRDPGSADDPGTPLERIQIVEGWVEDGRARERVVDVAGAAGDRADSLCAVWRDPDFDPEAPAYWYARVLEAPTPRWHTYVCRAKGVDCADPKSVGEGLEGCCDPEVPDAIRERAWTSPVWYVPR